MLTQVEVFTTQVSTSPLPVVGNSVAMDPIQIRKIDGLGPVEATINTTQYGYIPGEVYNGSTTGKRNIVMTLGLNPNYANQSVESLRQILYSYFMPMNQVKLRFTSTHMATVEIEGYVESFEPNMFESEPVVQVSIICPKSEFIATASTIVAGVTVGLTDETDTVIEYQGSLPTGFVLDIADSAVSAAMANGELRVYNKAPTTEIFIIYTTINPLQYLELCTLTGEKYVQTVLIDTSVTTNVLGTQSPGSVWIQLKQGTNNFRVASVAPGQSWTLEYYAKYGGI